VEWLKVKALSSSPSTGKKKKKAPGILEETETERKKGMSGKEVLTLTYCFCILITSPYLKIINTIHPGQPDPLSDH
jgi:hypothetical protein